MQQQSVRDMLVNAGVPDFLADMAIPFMWFMPGAVDPDSPSIIEINKGMQRSLRKLGYVDVVVNGVLDEETAQALDEVSPPPMSWMQKTFVQIYQDIERAKRNPEQSMQRTLALSGFGYGPLPGWRAGTPRGGLGAVIDAGTELTFGPGIRDKNAMVPIPRWSGTTYSAFVALQRAINRLLVAKSEFTGSAPGGRIGEDGVIGSGTYKAFKKVQDAHFRQSFVGDTNSAGLAANAVTLAATLGAKADALGVAAQANKGSATTSAAMEQTRAPLSQEEVLVLATQGPSSGIGDTLMTYLPFLALAGGIAWYAASKRKKGRS